MHNVSTVVLKKKLFPRGKTSLTPKIIYILFVYNGDPSMGQTHFMKKLVT